MSSIFTLSIVTECSGTGIYLFAGGAGVIYLFTIFKYSRSFHGRMFYAWLCGGRHGDARRASGACAVRGNGCGVCSGFITAFLQTRMGIESILAGIIVNTGLYTINIAVMGFASNVNLFGCDTIFSLAKETIGGSFYKIIMVAIVVAAVALILSWFLGTRLGLSIRATGDNPDMVKASSINPGFMITVGLCVANSLTGLSGALLAQYQKSCDINLGTGMVTIALASLIIGESIIGKGSILKRVCGVVLGSCLYRFLVAVALRLNVPAECLKLVSAIIVAVAIAFPYLKKRAAFSRQKSIAIRKRKEDSYAAAETHRKDI